MRPINAGLLGIGTVGGGTWEVLHRNADEIRRRAGRAIRIARVADKDLKKARRLVDGRAVLHRSAWEVVRAPDIDIVIELIGGTGIARDLVLEALIHLACDVLNECAARGDVHHLQPPAHGEQRSVSGQRESGELQFVGIARRASRTEPC